MAIDIGLFHKLLLTAIQKEASDVHLQVGSPPLLRLNGDLVELKIEPLTPADTGLIAKEILTNSFRQTSLDSLSEMDLSYGIEKIGRFRVNVFRQRGSFGIVLRVIPAKIRSFQELFLPPVMESISSLRRGLVLIVGATGNGKSTTIASMVEYINITRRAHIITIEDPIEFLFLNRRSVISQREVGTDTPSFITATVAAMRQDPDVLFIGEIRDTETAVEALKASETGHLVFASLHTTDTISALSRMIGFFPPDQETAIRKRLSECLMAVVALRLLPRKGVMGRVPAVEVLRMTRAIQDCIKDPSKTGDIQGYMIKGAEMYGMQTFNEHLIRLLRDEVIDIEVAKASTDNPAEMERALMMGGSGSQEA